jgi:hypothetical protein
MAALKRGGSGLRREIAEKANGGEALFCAGIILCMI